LLIAGTAVFTVASIACAIAPNLAVLLAARALQGIGAALLMPNSLAILGSAFSGEAKGRAVGTWAAAGSIASAAGPPLGGWLIDVVGWRAIFLLNVPVAAAAMAIAWRYVAESKQGGLSLDWMGAALATLALGLLTWALTLWSSHYAATGAVIIGLILGSVALGLFFFIEARRGDRAMMPLTLFGSRAFVGLTGLTSCCMRHSAACCSSFPTYSSKAVVTRHSLPAWPCCRFRWSSVPHRA
jgi:MFS family permease